MLKLWIEDKVEHSKARLVDAFKDEVSKANKLATDPGSRDGKREDDSDEFGDKGQGLFLDLCCGLNDADDEANKHTGQDRRSADDEGEE